MYEKINALLMDTMTKIAGEGSDRKLAAKTASTTIVIVLFLALHTFYFFFYWYLGVMPLVYYNVFSVLVYGCVVALNQRGHTLLAVYILNIEVSFYCIFNLLVFGWGCCTQWFLPAVIMPCQLVYPLNNKHRGINSGILVAALVFSSLFYDYAAPYAYMDLKPIVLVNLLILVAGLVVAVECNRVGEMMTEYYYDQQITSLSAGAYTDALTGLYNRRYAMERMEEMKSGSMPVTSFSVVMVDVDFFKNVNDSYGHAFGDSVLKGLASLIQNAFRVEDIAIRWGGEEFLVILINAHGDRVAERAEALRWSIEHTGFIVNGVAAKVTATLGISEFIQDREDDMDQKIEKTIEESDKALYYGKRNGRNQVVRYDNGSYRVVTKTGAGNTTNTVG